MRLIPSSEAFRVVELPAYEPCGSGEHLYLEIEKRGLTTDGVARALAEACGVPTRSVGWAGRKDRHAVTRQWFSVLGGSEAALTRLPTPPPGGALRVVQVSRHRNKLRLGHLRGNRFELRLSGDEALDPLEARLAERCEGGIPNRFGPQRFGVGGSTLATARAWGAGETPRGDRRYRHFIASSAQSAIFNAVLDARAAAGLLHRLRAGDLASRGGGRPFRCEPSELDDLNRRAAPGVLDVAATGPLPGQLRLRPDPAIDEEERAWSADTGVCWEWFEKGAPLESRGERRPLVIRFVEPPELAAEPGGARLVFALPRGSYATEVLLCVGVEVPEERGREDLRTTT
jgi:tRNA pseudouridine13 synthase